ncbi:MAG: protein TolQ [Bdellovibrionales bacterium]|nr:protein TolQ [Bdellovibrionales bacterium]
MNQAFAAAKEGVSVGVNLNAWDAIWSASPIVQLTLFCLVVMSVTCWAVIFAKKKQIDLLNAANGPFSDLFWKANSLDDIFDAIKDHPNSSLARLFKAGYLELRKIADSNLASHKEGAGPTTMLTGLDNLDRALRKTTDEELAGLESRLNVLATTGSTGPFIGLFGTVWGIMGAFQKIGATKVASLAVVAPGISEALIATAVGLAAAIPATVAYNHFVSRIRKMEIELTSFGADFLNIAKRNFFQG